MKQISNKEYEKYQQYQTDKLHGRILTPDGLRIVCAGLDNDPEKIGIHMLEMLVKFRNAKSESISSPSSLSELICSFSN